MYKAAIEGVSLAATVLCWLHFWYVNRSLEKVVRFFSGAVFLGALAEAAAIAFTDSYEYPGYHLYIGPVPLFVAVGWGANFYYTHGIATELSRHIVAGRARLWLLGLISGLAGVLLDLCFDPVAVSLEWWVWANGSWYFGVPLANFFGWFALCMSFSVAFAWTDARQGLGFVQRTLLLYLLLLVGFLTTALITFPFLAA